MTTPPKSPDVRSKWTQRAMEIGFLFGAGFTALLWLAAAFLYAVRVASGEEAVSPGPMVTGVMLGMITIPIMGFCTAILIGMATFFTELAVRFARRGRDPDVKALADVLSQAERRFAPRAADSPPAEAIRPPEGLTAPPPEPEPTPPNEEIRL